MARGLIALILIVAAIFVVSSQAQLGAQQSIREVLEGYNATRFIAYVDDAGLSSWLNSSTAAYTVFAPTNAAFAHTFNNNTPSDLKQLIEYHFVEANIQRPALTNGLLLSSLLQLPSLSNGFQRLAVSTNKDTVYINNAQVQAWNNNTNGIVYLIEQVLIPPSSILSVVNTTQSNQLVALFARANMTNSIDAQNAITMFVPTNSALEGAPALLGYLQLSNSTAELKHILSNHVASDLFYNTPAFPPNSTYVLYTQDREMLILYKSTSGEIQINKTVPITQANILASNGVAHLISGLLLPTDFAFTFEKALWGLNDTVLYQALNATGLLDVLLNTSMSYTVFAPSNKAFHNYDSKLLTKSVAEQLKVVRRHIVKGVHTNLKDGDELKNLNNETILVQANKTAVTIEIKGAGPDAYIQVFGKPQYVQNGALFTMKDVIEGLDESEPLSELMIIIIVCICVPLLLVILAIVLVFDLRRYLRKRRALHYDPLY